jgi:hypothetical protein
VGRCSRTDEGRGLSDRPREARSERYSPHSPAAQCGAIPPVKKERAAGVHGTPTAPTSLREGLKVGLQRALPLVGISLFILVLFGTLRSLPDAAIAGIILLPGWVMAMPFPSSRVC